MTDREVDREERGDVSDAPQSLGALAIESARTEQDVTRLHLFDGPFLMVDGQRLDLPDGAGRLLVHVALSGSRVSRRSTAGALWAIGNDVRAAGNLRSALWRLRSAGIDLIRCDKQSLWLAEHTEVDVTLVNDWAERLINGRYRPEDLNVGRWLGDPLSLLPGWYEDWVIFAREQLRQRWLHGLEALSRCLVNEGRHPQAVDAALAVVVMDPLRESAQRVLIEAHLAEGNVAEARRSFRLYGERVRRELGVAPSRELRALLATPEGSRPPVAQTDDLGRSFRADTRPPANV